jgi:hypothetical protein
MEDHVYAYGWGYQLHLTRQNGRWPYFFWIGQGVPFAQNELDHVLTNRGVLKWGSIPQNHPF